MITFEFDLQMFANGGGALVNATGNYVNAYTGDVTSFSGKNDLSAENKTYYDTELLENARPEMVHRQFAKTQPLPKNKGKTVEWRKFNTLANASALTEGVIPTGQKMGVSYITDTVGEYGTYVSVSDTLDLTAIDPVVLEAQVELSASAGRTDDELVRNDIIGGTNVMYAQKNTSGTMSDCSSRSDLNENCKMTADTVNRAATTMKKMLAPKIKGDYVCIIHPSVSYDLRNSDGWKNPHEYCDPNSIYEGEIGKLHGVRFVETTQAKVVKGTPLTAAAPNLTVASLESTTNKVITVDEAISATEAAAIKAAGYINVKGYHKAISDCTAGAAGAATITLSAAWSGGVADGDIIYPGDGALDGSAIYLSLVLGADAYGVIALDGGGLEMIMHDKAQAGGPLNQFSTIGYKMYTNGAKILYEDRILRIESCGAWSATDDVN